MHISFDLISDLHIETWQDNFDWTGMPTSVICVLAGDVCRDHETLEKVLKHLSSLYKAVIYVDGNDEHRWSLNNLADSYKSIQRIVDNIENVFFLQDNVVVIDGVGFCGTNAWWTYDFDDDSVYEYSKQWLTEKYSIDLPTASNLEEMALQDTAYLVKTVKRLQTHADVKKIVVVTHTVPDVELVSHDPELEGSHRLNCLGNSHILKTFIEDTEHKIDTWCFGHYHNDIDNILHGVRFVNNCRGRGDTKYCKVVYNPKKIVVDL